MNGVNLSTATDIRLGGTSVSAVYFGSTKLWPSGHDYSQDYLTFKALEAGTFTWTDTENNNSISYSIDDGSTWITLASGSSTPTINANNKVIFKASTQIINPSSGIGTFSSTGSFDAMGNIMSLVYGDNFANQTEINRYQFYKLFKSSRIVDASNLILPATILSESCYREMFDSSELEITPKSLPATTLAGNCYRSMFGNCVSLITVMSILPAMTLLPNCYKYMFGKCNSLTTAPVLPATTLANNCYQQMFSGCTALTTAPVLPATTLANNCYQQMFNGCTALTTVQELPATTLATYCYGNMFYGCTNLTTAPELPATTLVSNCYYRMFYNCSRLNYIKAMFTTDPSTLYTSSWVYGVASSGTFVKNSAASWNVTGVNGIPSGWTVQDAT